jgi:hypothetical protein
MITLSGKPHDLKGIGRGGGWNMKKTIVPLIIRPEK